MKKRDVMILIRKTVLYVLLLGALPLLGCQAGMVSPSPEPLSPGPQQMTVDEAKNALIGRGIEFSGSAFLKSAWDGDGEAVALFLYAGMSAETRTDDGETALMNAAWNGHSAVVKKLLDNGADVNAVNRYGWTVLMSAALGCYRDTVIILLDRGAAINAKDNDGKTALMYSVREKCTDTVRPLIERGADVNARTEHGETALKLARDTSTRELLLEAGASE